MMLMLRMLYARPVRTAEEFAGKRIGFGNHVWDESRFAKYAIDNPPSPIRKTRQDERARGDLSQRDEPIEIFGCFAADKKQPLPE